MTETPQPTANTADINPVSRQFIDWAKQQLTDDTTYQQLLDEALERVHHYYKQPKTELLAALEAKLIRGAKEHGVPINDINRIHLELEGEYIDLIGWLL